METQSRQIGLNALYALEAAIPEGVEHRQNVLSREEIVAAIERLGDIRNRFQQDYLPMLAELLNRLPVSAGKRSFLVLKRNKYLNVLTDNIAFFCIKYESSVITCFNKEEYFVNHSLDQIQQMLPKEQFFRLNRQYLINFNAVKEVEHYFARKLLVNPVIPVKDKLLVPREKIGGFLHWLDDR